MADVVVVNKVDAAARSAVQRIEDAVRALRPEVPLVRAASPVVLDDPGAVLGRRVVVVDDGPTLTHGGMPYGAGWVAASAAGAAEIVDPRPFADPAIREVYARYPPLERVLPALGYGPGQLAALARTLDATPADVVVSGTPLDLARLVPLAKPVVRARYRYAPAGSPGLADLLDAFLRRIGLPGSRPCGS
jgi:predicted GTPase